ncbi:MAG TPA: hypothetical protein VNL37_00365 [Candidatus Polarisedimenticolia bacterium]|nr:hypothetical protein [Candidatus Polarisedimenticolia bacterium]
MTPRLDRLTPFALLALLLVPAGGSRAQDLKRPEEQLAAIYTLKVQLDIEQRRLDGALQRYADVGRERDEILGHLKELNDGLDDMIEGRKAAEAGEIATAEKEVRQAEQRLDDLSAEGRQLRMDIRDAHNRIDLLQDRIGRLRRTLPSDQESLTGSWDVTFLPSGDKGSFMLRQSGALLVGEYALEGGWKGSLQGTFVDGKVLLHRIDSKLGRTSDLEGSLSADGTMLRGTWVNLVLSGGQPATGAWVARKHSEKGADAPDEP